MNVLEEDRKQDQIFLFLRQGPPWAIFPGRPHYYSTETSAPAEPDGWSLGEQKEEEKKRRKNHPWKLDHNKIENKVK